MMPLRGWSCRLDLNPRNSLLAQDRVFDARLPHLDVFRTSNHRKQFLAAAQAAARLENPNIVAVHEAGEAGGVCFIASDYSDGITLATWLEQQPSLMPPRDAAELVATMADAMQHAHDRGVLHRDLKPSNILLEAGKAKGGRSIPMPRIGDFGLAGLLEQEAESARSGAIRGTPCYMAPEQVEGRSADVSPATDVYALGAILYEILADRPPFKGATLLDTFEQVRIREPLSPARLHPKLPRDLETICLKCLRKETGHRYASAADLAADLRRFAAGKPIFARPTSLRSKIGPWRRLPERATQTGFMMLVLGNCLTIWCLVTAGLLAARTTQVDRPSEALALGTALMTLLYVPILGIGLVTVKRARAGAFGAGLARLVRRIGGLLTNRRG